VVGVLTSVEFAAGPLGYLLVGPLVEALGLRPAFLSLSAALILVTLTAIPANGLRLLDEPPRYAAAPVGPPAAHGPVPLGEQSIPPAA
jgi:hypothetical protein